MLKNKKITAIAVVVIIVLILIGAAGYTYYNLRGKYHFSVFNDEDYKNNSMNNNVMLNGINIHDFNMKDSEIKKITEAGLKVVRVDLFWASIENKKGVYDFSNYDSFVKNMDNNNVKILFILDYGNKLYDKGLSPYTDEGRKAFVNFAKAAVKRYKGKQIIWEIWNEPNASFWFPKPNWEDYSKLALKTVKEIRKVDKNEFIIAPAASEVHFDFLNYLGKQGLFRYIDGVSVHPYRKLEPETAVGDYKDLKKLISNYPHKENIQIVSSEWGYHTAKDGISENKQAQYIAREYLINIMSGVKISIWYDWKNDGADKNNGEHNYGIINSDLTPKPSYYAVKTMNKTLEGYRYIKRLETESKEDYILMFKKDNKIIYAIWTTNEDHDVTINTQKDDLQIVTLTGENYNVKAQNKKYNLPIEQNVKYVID